MVQKTLGEYIYSLPLSLCCTDKDGNPLVLQKNRLPETLLITYSINNKIKRLVYPENVAEVNNRLFFSKGSYVIDEDGKVVFKGGTTVKDLNGSESKLVIATSEKLSILDLKRGRLLMSLSVENCYERIMSGCLDNKRLILVKRKFHAEKLDNIVEAWDLKDEERIDSISIPIKGCNTCVRPLDYNKYVFTNAVGEKRNCFSLGVVNFDAYEVKVIDTFKVESLLNERQSNRMVGLDTFPLSEGKYLVAFGSGERVYALKLEVDEESVTPKEIYTQSDLTGPVAILEKNEEDRRINLRSFKGIILNKCSSIDMALFNTTIYIVFNFTSPTYFS